MIEIWKNIKGYPNYQVSNMGKIKSLERYVNSKNGSRRIVREKTLKSNSYKKNYLTVKLSNNGNPKTFRLHNLVLEMFIPNPFNKPCGNHKNGKKWDNRVENLEWVTYQENTIHAYRTGLLNKKTQEKPVNQIKDGIVIATFKSQHEAERQTGIHLTSISDCCLKKKYRKTAGGYTWEFANKKQKERIDR
jgi:hypothetical protein